MSRRMSAVRRLRLLPALLALTTTAAMLAACGTDTETETSAVEPTVQASTATDETSTTAEPSETAEPAVSLPVPKPKVAPIALRPGERRQTLAMPETYTPSVPEGSTGTDDYHCFLLDPKLTKDTFLTGTNILPGNPDMVHHVIIFRVPKEGLAEAKAADAAQPGEGWTCFGNANFGTTQLSALDNAQWLGAWAPGGKESVAQAGLGTKLEKGTRIVLQIHYNLLLGQEPDRSAIQLRLAPGDAPLTELHTMLMPAPVELPCRKGKTDNPLCDRAASLADVKERFGQQEGSLADALHLLCNTKAKPSEVTTCTRTIGETTTIRAAAGHMHLLGRSIKIEVNPGTDRARTILDIPVWDFDDQGARQIESVTLQPWDTVKVTCRHVQWLRDQLPSFEGQPDRYVLWGEGTTDEMCLGILTVTRP